MTAYASKSVRNMFDVTNVLTEQSDLQQHMPQLGRLKKPNDVEQQYC